MDTNYGKTALEDTALYQAIVEHRRKFYHLSYVNYDLDYPAAIKFVPEGETLDAYRRDYNDNMVNGYIYGEAMAFDALMKRIKLLQQRFRDIYNYKVKNDLNLSRLNFDEFQAKFLHTLELCYELSRLFHETRKALIKDWKLLSKPILLPDGKILSITEAELRRSIH